LHQFGFNYMTSVAVIFTVVQFHHVITDGVIWRLKDPRTRALLMRSAQEAVRRTPPMILVGVDQSGKL
jgi:hypothetical protein